MSLDKKTGFNIPCFILFDCQICSGGTTYYAGSLLFQLGNINLLGFHASY